MNIFFITSTINNVMFKCSRGELVRKNVVKNANEMIKLKKYINNNIL